MKLAFMNRVKYGDIVPDTSDEFEATYIEPIKTISLSKTPRKQRVKVKRSSQRDFVNKFNDEIAWG